MTPGGPAGRSAAPPGLARRVAVEAAEAAGAVLVAGASAPLGTAYKGGAGDVVTDLDLAAERVIIERIRADFPAHRIVSEEAGVIGDHARWSWLVDPLDGTNNIAIGLPVYVVGIALCRDRVPVLGVVHDPVAGQTWVAERGLGATGPGGAPLAPGPVDLPYGPVVSWIQGHEVPRADPAATALQLALGAAARRVLQLWAPLVSWVMLARGTIHAVVGYRAEAVDLPAGALLASESGLAVCAFDGTPYDQGIGRPARERCFLAARPEHIPRLVAVVAAATRLEPAVRALDRHAGDPAW